MVAPLVAVAVGVWLMAAPAALGYTGGRADDLDRILGPIAAAFALVAVWEVTRPVRWATLPIGLWLVAAPWILGYGAAATVNDMAAGAVLAVTPLIGRSPGDRYGGGWSSLATPRPGLADPSERSG